MQKEYVSFVQDRLSDTQCQRLMEIPIPKVHQFVVDSIELCNPDSVIVMTDSTQDIKYVRDMALKTGEERPLKTAGHTYHFDGMQDQGRDREATKYLVPETESLSKALNQTDRDVGLDEVRSLLKNSMEGRTMIVRFLSLGPTGSIFTVPCLQITDSWYVAHSEDLLYRPAYAHFKQMGDDSHFFQFLHSAGKMNENKMNILIIQLVAEGTR